MKNKTVYIIGSAIALLLLTRKKYYIKDFSVFVPNVSLIGIKQSKDNSIANLIRKNIEYKIDNYNLTISIRPIDGFKLPYHITLPIDTLPITIPQLIYQIGSKLKVMPVIKFGIVVGQEISIKGVWFYG